MNAQTDLQLLHAYAERGSETAFAELVRRHIDLVLSAAFRMVNDPHLAKDVSQGVFVALAKDAGKLVDHPVAASNRPEHRRPNPGRTLDNSSPEPYEPVNQQVANHDRSSICAHS